MYIISSSQYFNTKTENKKTSSYNLKLFYVSHFSISFLTHACDDMNPSFYSCYFSLENITEEVEVFSLSKNYILKITVRNAKTKEKKTWRFISYTKISLTLFLPLN